MGNLSGKSVLITGASQGIGAAAARAFAQEGAQVALVARSRDAIVDLAGEIGDAALAIPCDVSRYWEVAAAVDATVSAFGGLDVLINNAGVIHPITRLDAAEPEDWNHAIDINLKGVFHCIHASLPVMRSNGGGTIIGVSSGAAHSPLEGWSAYCSSKAGAAMLTSCLDAEERENGIRALGLSPGTVATDMQVKIKASGINRVSELHPSVHISPDWPARALVWLTSTDADEFIGTEISLRDETIRRRIGLI